MGRRTKNTQTKHDAEVRRLAKGLEKKGFDVHADIKGYKQPGTLGGFRPDVVATKGKERKILEVETPDSDGNSRDQKQQQAFKKAAQRSLKTTFKRIITK